MSILTELPPNLYPLDAFANFSSASRFELGTARAMIWLSQLAYEVAVSRKVDEILHNWGLTRVAPASAHVNSLADLIDLNALVLTKGPTILVAFQGTDPLRLAHWITDLNVPLSADGVHQGFEDAINAIWGELDTAIMQSMQGNAHAQLFFTGHSLGGALAVLAAAKADGAGEPIAGVYTFGMPRTGNAAFVNAYNARLGDRTYRLVYGVDIVPMVPPSTATPLDYRHVGRYLPSVTGRFHENVLTENPQGLPAEKWSDEPNLAANLRDQVADFTRNGPAAALTLLTRVTLAWRLSLGAKPALQRSDPVGFLIEHLPPPLRDHVPDRYCQALAAGA